MNIYTVHIHKICSTYTSHTHIFFYIYIICYIIDEGTRAHAPTPIIISVVDSDMAVIFDSSWDTSLSGPNDSASPRFGRFGEITSIKIMYPRTGAVKW